VRGNGVGGARNREAARLAHGGSNYCARVSLVEVCGVLRKQRDQLCGRACTRGLVPAVRDGAWRGWACGQSSRPPWARRTGPKGEAEETRACRSIEESPRCSYAGEMRRSHVAGAVQTRARRAGRGDDVARLKFYFV
jgi:hypothetical protein